MPRGPQSLPHANQGQPQLALHFCHFSKTQLRCPKIMEEAFALLALIECSYWFVSCAKGCDFFTIANNYKFIFNPLSITSDVLHGTTCKLFSWDIHISLPSYVAIHISGDDNVWVDLKTGWIITVTVYRLVTKSLIPPTSTNFKWPAVSPIRYT